MLIATWNLQWAIPGTSRESRMRHELATHNCEILVLTEASLETAPQDGYVVSAAGSWGYEPQFPSHRKVLLWSRNPWTVVDPVGSDRLPSGRFVVASTETSLGLLRVMGVCIPWKDAHVRTGLKNRLPWEDHMRFIHGLSEFLGSTTESLVLAGDFNQRIPTRFVPSEVGAALATMLDRFDVPTSSAEHSLIDHIALTADLKGHLVSILPKSDSFGSLTDHVGVIVKVRR